MITTFDTLSPHPATPDWVLHLINQKFIEGDLMVHSTEIAIRSGQQSPIPKYIHATSSDTSCKAWRKWWAKYGLSTSPPQTFGPASPDNLELLDRKALTDPWSAHTSKCSKCRAVLRRCKMLRRLGTVVAWSALALFRRNFVLACMFGSIGGLTTYGATRLMRELEGPISNGEVPDRSLSAAR